MVWEVLIAVGKVGDQLGKFLLINQWWGVMMMAEQQKIIDPALESHTTLS